MISTQKIQNAEVGRTQNTNKVIQNILTNTITKYNNQLENRKYLNKEYHLNNTNYRNTKYKIQK